MEYILIILMFAAPNAASSMATTNVVTPTYTDSPTCGTAANLINAQNGVNGFGGAGYHVHALCVPKL